MPLSRRKRRHNCNLLHKSLHGLPVGLAEPLRLEHSVPVLESRLARQHVLFKCSTQRQGLLFRNIAKACLTRCAHADTVRFGDFLRQTRLIKEHGHERMMIEQMACAQCLRAISRSVNICLRHLTPMEALRPRQCPCHIRRRGFTRCYKHLHFKQDA